MSETNENKSKAEQMKATANAAYQKASEKADALYNKLPLDSINEKLASKGIKVDVKSRKFKLALAGVAALLVVLLVWFGCRGGEKNNAGGGRNSSAKVNPNAAFVFGPKWHTDEGVEFLKSLVPQAHEFMAWFKTVDKLGIKMRDYPELQVKSFREILKFFREKEEFEKVYQEQLKEITAEDSTYQVEVNLERQMELNRHWHYIQDNFVNCFNQRLGEIRSVFQVVELDVPSLRLESKADGYSGEVWRGQCRLFDTQTGAEFMENFSCMIEWDKNGDTKYDTRSYDRPIRLEWLWLHDVGQNNYLSDPRY
ncbi:MAG: hypothetical protein II943_05475 [Victivallales bacterium]|nr:hypothetical protein [Victivallales bacterium]